MSSHQKVSIIILMLIVAINVANSELFSSMVHLKQAVGHIRNNNITNYLKAYVDQQKQTVGNLKQFAEELEQFQLSIQRTTESHLQHPLGALAFVEKTNMEFSDTNNKRTVAVLDEVSIPFNKQHILDVMAEFPTERDVHGMANGILGIQEVYQFKTDVMASGQVGPYGSRGFTFEERMEIARLVPVCELWVQNKAQYADVKSIEWLDAALDVASNDKQTTELVKSIEDAFGRINCLCSFRYLGIMKRVRLLNREVQIHENCTSVMPFTCEAIRTGAIKLPDQLNFEAICRGEEPSPLADPGRITPHRLLRCRYSHFNDHRLMIDPIKEEELNFNNPRISILHDIMTESQVQYFQSTSAPLLTRGKYNTTEGEKASFHKVSQQYKIQNTKLGPKTRNLMERLSGVTNLHMNGFDDEILVMHYGSGGVFGVHMDVLTRHSVQNFTRGIFNRVASILGYMNEVKYGGETVFPGMAINVKPKKYSAVLFFNMYRNGDSIELSKHSSCPIVYGEKWIMNQGVRNWGQEFHYRCSVDEFE